MQGRWREREGEKEDVSSYLKETRRRYWSLKTKSEVTLYRRLGLEEVMDIYQDGIRND